MTVLDLDLDFFVRPVAYDLRDEGPRLLSKDYSVWPLLEKAIQQASSLCWKMRLHLLDELSLVKLRALTMSQLRRW